MRHPDQQSTQIILCGTTDCPDLRDPELPFVLHFNSLLPRGRAFSFPCNARGQVNLDDMNERMRNNYLYARAMTGRELSWPQVRSTRMRSEAAKP